MAEYIFGARNNIHIIDLAQTVPMLHNALQAVSDTVAKGGRVLFVGTKRQAQDGVAEAAKRSAQYFVNSRWLGGTLTNWKTISGSIKRLRHLDEVLARRWLLYTKKERLTLQRERDKLDRSLGGIKDMGGLPDLIFVIDTNKEDIAIQEAQRLNIPVAAIVDTNSDPKGITYVVPGNDDAGRAITLYCDLVARAAIDGISRAQGDSGIDIGASARPVARKSSGGAAAASRASPGRAASPTISRSSRACRARSRRSSTISASSTTGSSPSSITTPRTRSAKKSDCRAGRCLGGQGQGDDRRSGIAHAMAGQSGLRFQFAEILMDTRRGDRAAPRATRQARGRQRWQRSQQRWSRTCASPPAQA